MPRRATPESFWSNVRIGVPEKCWTWKLATDEHGYGRVRYHQKEWSSHHLAWVLTHGDPGNRMVLHSCDNPPCCNPGHLFTGTQADNMADSAKKGRHPRNKTGYLPSGDQHHARRTPEVMARGERNGSAVLTARAVRRIRRLRETGMTLRALASRFGVAKGTVLFIVQRKTWGHLK